MAWIRIRLMFLLVLDPVQPDWTPNISAVVYKANKSLVVNVHPKVEPIDHLKVCVSEVSRIYECFGTVHPMESPDDTLRYSVTELLGNRSYYIYIKPFRKDGSEITRHWTHKRTPVFIEQWAEDVTDKAEHVDDSSVTEVLVALLLVVLLAAVAIFCLWKKGYLQKIKILRCCLPRSAFVGQPIKVLQLYVLENEPFQQVVQKHMVFLQKYLNVESTDCYDMRLQQNEDQLLQNACADSRIIVYVSPKLMQMLHHSMGAGGQGQCGDVITHPHLPARKYAQLIQRLTDPAALKKGRGKGRNPVFILSGCFHSDTDDEKFLSQQPNLRTLQCHWISKGRQLTAPDPLLSKLSGCHHSFFSTRDWTSSEQARDLSQAVSQLHELTYRDCYVRLDEMELGDVGAARDGAAGLGEFGCERGEQEHFYSSVTEEHSQVRRCPHRTDSGFSSSTADHNRCSRGSSEGNSSPGVQGAEDFMEEDLHSERDPMLGRYPHSMSASQTFSFQPPESVGGGDTDSIVLDAELRMVNSAGESHWSPTV